MALELIVTNSRIDKNPQARAFLEYIRDNAPTLKLTSAVAYYEFPSYVDYEAESHKADVVILCPSHGVISITFIPLLSENRAKKIESSLTDFTSNLVSRLLRSREMRSSLTALSFPVSPLLFANGEGVESEEVQVCTSFGAFAKWLAVLEGNYLNKQKLSEARSIIEGAKALARAQKRSVDDPAKSPIAAALATLEAEIANFDEKQRRIALVDVGGPARIRGLAGSGKTVILAMKAAQLHMEDPESRILVTFYTRSLRATLKSLITKFFRHYTEADPDWTKVHIRHGWGSSSGPGVYADTSRRHNLAPVPLNVAQREAGYGKNAFGWAVRQLLERVEVDPYYDHVLIDEGQDFPDSFYELAYLLTKGDKDRKSIVWAYDELQNILNVEMRQAERLFGKDADGTSRVDLDRSSPNVPIGATNDAVLSKTYRNQRSILVVAHALGFGVYGKQIVQMLESAAHWRDVGYDVLSGEIEIGKPVELIRPEENSPLDLSSIPGTPLIETFAAANFDAEAKWAADQVRQFIAGGLNAEDVLIISLDDRNAKGYFNAISALLAENDINSNNIIADPYNEPPFTIAGKVTLSTVYRAKGNEAALVIAVGVDAVRTEDRNGRNKLFTAFTRTKGWLRVSGVGDKAGALAGEIDRAFAAAPKMTFVMPDPAKVDTIQRGLSKKHARAKAAREEYIRKLKAAGLTEDEINEQLSVGAL